MPYNLKKVELTWVFLGNNKMEYLIFNIKKSKEVIILLKEYQLAHLSNNEKERISKIEKEIGKILIAWEKTSDDNRTPSQF